MFALNRVAELLPRGEEDTEVGVSRYDDRRVSNGRGGGGGGGGHDGRGR